MCRCTQWSVHMYLHIANIYRYIHTNHREYIQIYYTSTLYKYIIQIFSTNHREPPQIYTYKSLWTSVSYTFKWLWFFFKKKIMRDIHTRVIHYTQKRYPHRGHLQWCVCTCVSVCVQIPMDVFIKMIPVDAQNRYFPQILHVSCFTQQEQKCVCS